MTDVHDDAATMLAEEKTIVRDADYYRIKAAQLRRTARATGHHDRDTLLELANQLHAKAQELDAKAAFQQESVDYTSRDLEPGGGAGDDTCCSCGR